VALNRAVDSFVSNDSVADDSCAFLNSLHRSRTGCSKKVTCPDKDIHWSCIYGGVCGNSEQTIMSLCFANIGLTS
jgi:hypothetical protein